MFQKTFGLAEVPHVKNGGVSACVTKGWRSLTPKTVKTNTKETLDTMLCFALHTQHTLLVLPEVFGIEVLLGLEGTGE